MIRILQSVNIMDRAGLETMLMNYYRNIDRDVIQFDFLTHRPQDGAYDEEIKSLGGRVYHAPRLYLQNLPSYYKYMSAFFDKHKEYKIIHSHIDAMSFFPLRAAKQNGIPIRIAHSHNSHLEKDLKFPIKYMAQKSIGKVANQYYACGKLAGDFMFHDSQYSVIHNAINLDDFVYNESERIKTRKQLGLEDKFVIGHVGRFCRVKNQLFVLDIFTELLKIKNNSVLLLIGKGQDEQKIRDKIKALGISDKVRILIDRSDVNDLYQAMDIFILPSLSEGLPVVGIEAQANGLTSFVSDTISPEIVISNSIKQLPLSYGAEKWAAEIASASYNRNVNAKIELQNAGYDIKIEAEKLQKKYLDLIGV